MGCHLTWAVIQSDRHPLPSRTVRTFTTSNVWPQNVQHTHSKVRGSINTREREGEGKSESIFTISLFIQARYARRSPRSTSYLNIPSPLSSHLPHLLHTRKAHIHIVNCILYLVSVSLLSVKCKVNTRYFTQICQVFAQRVWARPTHSGLQHIVGCGVAHCATAECNGIYCNLHFNAQMRFLCNVNVN